MHPGARGAACRTGRRDRSQRTSWRAALTSCPLIALQKNGETIPMCSAFGSAAPNGTCPRMLNWPGGYYYLADESAQQPESLDGLFGDDEVCRREEGNLQSSAGLDLMVVGLIMCNNTATGRHTGAPLPHAPNRAKPTHLFFRFCRVSC